MKKTNWSLIVGLLLPVVMIIAVTLSIYIPSRLQTFHGRFLYFVQDNGYWGGSNVFTVVNERLIERPAPMLPHAVGISTGTIQLYLHDIEKNESRDISIEEAKQLMLDSSPRSSNGVQIDYGSQGDGLFPFLIFERMDYSAVYVKGDHGSRKLNVKIKPGNYYNQFQFIGWVKS